MSSKSKLVDLLFDSTCFFLIFILFIVVRILIFGTNEGLYPTKHAFLCEDTNINWPYQEESVGVAVITFLSYIIPIVVVRNYLLSCHMFLAYY